MSTNGYILLDQSLNLTGTVSLYGAKNSVLPVMASLILTKGVSVINNVPNSTDVKNMIKLLLDLGAKVKFDVAKNNMRVDTTNIKKTEVEPEIMNKMRASILVMGPLLARFGLASVAMPGGCLIGARPIDLHLKGFLKLGVGAEQEKDIIKAFFKNENCFDEERRVVLEYPSVGATENLAMFASLLKGTTTIVNAALEPEVLDFLNVLKKMGADIELEVPSIIKVRGVSKLNPINHEIIPDRLEAGALLLSAAITGGSVNVSNASSEHMDIFIEKLKDMGHKIETGLEKDGKGIRIKASKKPKAVSFKTGPYPGFPTDLQAPMMVAQCLAEGTSCIEETVFENRLMHVKELEKMGAQIKLDGSKAIVKGVEKLYGSKVIASDIRASAALALAGLVAQGQTQVFGINHWERGYDKLEDKLKTLGAKIKVFSN